MNEEKHPSLRPVRPSGLATYNPPESPDWRGIVPSRVPVARQTIFPKIRHRTHADNKGACAAIRLQTLRPWRGPAELVQRFWGYAIWSFLQQFLLQIYFLQRTLRLVSSKKLAVGLAVAVFTLAHLPNPLLTLATLVWGCAACLLFLRYRNLIPLGVTHAILGITIALCFPGQVTHNMRVGLGYLTYTPKLHRHHRPQTVIAP